MRINNSYFQKPKPRDQKKGEPEKFVVELPYDFEHGDRPDLSVEEHQGISSLSHIFPAILTGLPELNPGNRDDLFPAYYAYRMGKLSGIFILVTCVHLNYRFFRCIVDK